MYSVLYPIYKLKVLLFEILVECFETHIAYSGRNIGDPKEIKGDVKECRDMCASTEGCKFFTFRGSECLLMSEVLNKNPDKNAISGAKEDTCAGDGKYKNKFFLFTKFM